MLARRGWRGISVLERSDESLGEPTKSFTYRLTPAGLKILDAVGLTDVLQRDGVVVEKVEMIKIDGRQKKKQERRVWLPSPKKKAQPSQAETKPKNLPIFILRPVLLAILRQHILENYADQVQMLHEVEVLEMTRFSKKPSASGADASPEASIRVTARKLPSKGAAKSGSEAEEVMVFEPTLVIGADGVKSVVRRALHSWFAADNGEEVPNPFSMRLFPSASTGLCYKAALVPADIPLDNSGENFAEPGRAYAVTGVKKGLKRQFSLWSLPVSAAGLKLAGGGRTAAFAGVGDHELFACKTGEEVLSFLEEGLPHVPVRSYITPSEAEKFAKTQGVKFPPPQCCDRLQWVLLGGGGGVVLLGDAVHCFPPDLGAGVNAALQDVLVLRDAMAAADDDLGAALPAFERERVPESYGLVRCVQVGFPWQYQQNILRKNLWIAGFMVRSLANKLLPFIVSEPLVRAALRPEASYAKVWAAECRSNRRIVAATAAAAAIWLFRRAALLPMHALKHLRQFF